MIAGVGCCVFAAVLLLLPVSPSRLGRLLAGAGRGAAERRGRRAPVTDASLILDLIAAALRSGIAPAAALGIVADADETHREELRVLARCLELGQDLPAGPESELSRQLRTTLLFAHTTGAPAAGLVQAKAGELRRRRVREEQAAAGRLAVRLVLPLGVCVLPAFIALGVMPVVLSLVSDLAGIF